MSQNKEDQHPIPMKPKLKPIDHQQIDDFVLQFEEMSLESEENVLSLPNQNTQTSINIDDDNNSEEIQESQSSSLKRRHSQTQQIFPHSKSMLCKLEQLERVSTKRRHYCE